MDAVIREEIAREGVIPVARFIELALYLPNHGYYRRLRTPFGSTGDFYTAEQLQPVFGELLASYAAQVFHAAVWEDSFSILELGCGSGAMRSALAPWNYCGFDWTCDPLPLQMCGLVIANEFFDALPVHLLRKNKDAWREVGVSLQSEKLALTEMPLTAPSLVEYARRYGSPIPDGGQLEVSLDAGDWFAKLSRIQRRGNLLVIDYGYSGHELERLNGGTLMTYRRHHASADFLSEPGERDITAHVNFSYLRQLALEFGYRIEADVSLRAWIEKVWNEEELSALWKERDQRWKLQWKQLVVGMGETFRVLELRKPGPEEETLSKKEKAPGV